jgi:hypothetical protein
MSFKAVPNRSSASLLVIDEVSVAVLEQRITTALPATAHFLLPRLFLDTGPEAATVDYYFTDVHMEPDFLVLRCPCSSPFKCRVSMIGYAKKRFPKFRWQSHVDLACLDQG